MNIIVALVILVVINYVFYLSCTCRLPYIDIRKREYTQDFKWFARSPKYEWWMDWVDNHRKNESVYVLLFGHTLEIYIVVDGLAKVICDKLFKVRRPTTEIKE